MPGQKRGWLEHPAVPYALPFVALIAFLAVHLDVFGRWEYPLRVVVLAALVWVSSRRVVSFRAPHWLGSVLLGVAVFFVWVAPDVLLPVWRRQWFFENALMGAVKSSLPESLRGDWMVLVFRSLRAVVLVPIIEELFWRGWLMRWLIETEFERVPLGKYTHAAFWLTALLFAFEHGPYWDVGLLAGIAYNAWMVRVRNLGDCILAHAVTNACLSAYVILAGQWEYWM